MLKDRRNLARDVAGALHALEQLVDDAIVSRNDLETRLVRGRRDVRLPLDAGQAGLDRMAEAQALLLAARAKIHAAHLEFRDVQDKMKVGPLGFGDYGDTPREYAPSGLSVVPAVAIADAA